MCVKFMVNVGKYTIHGWLNIPVPWNIMRYCFVSLLLEDRQQIPAFAGLADVTSRGGENGRLEFKSPLANLYGI